MITISIKAAEEFEKARLNSKNPEKTRLRITLVKLGCTGPSLKLTLDESTNKDDMVIETIGVPIIFAADLEPCLNKSFIEYSNKWFEGGFHITGVRLSSC